MRVALVALSVRGANGQHIEELASALSARVELTLFVPDHIQGDLRNVQTCRFRTGHHRLDALMRLTDPRLARREWQRILDAKPDVVHLFNGEGIPWSLLWARWASRAGVPLLITVHDPQPHPGDFWGTANAFLRRYVIPRAAIVHIFSSVFTRTVQAEGARKVAVIPHGSLAPRFLRHREPGVTREPLALFFGRIEYYKGIEVLVEAGLRLRGRVRVAIAGPGRLSRSLLRTILQYAEVFELHNRYLSDAEVARLFQRAAVCVLPYRQATQSSVPLIAAAFGVPVVATTVGAFIEDVPRVGGLLVPPGDSEALAEAIMAAMSVTPQYPSSLEYPSLSGQYVEMYLDAMK